jgi:hypothetical protein
VKKQWVQIAVRLADVEQRAWIACGRRTVADRDRSPANTLPTDFVGISVVSFLGSPTISGSLCWWLFQVSRIVSIDCPMPAFPGHRTTRNSGSRQGGDQ